MGRSLRSSVCPARGCRATARCNGSSSTIAAELRPYAFSGWAGDGVSQEPGRLLHAAIEAAIAARKAG